MAKLRKADIEESVEIFQFYQNVIDSIKDSEFEPKWNKNYPDLDYVKKCIKNKELYVYKENDTIIACIVMNNRFEHEYEGIDWISNVKPDEITVLHTFAVDSNFAGKGIGKQIFNRIKDIAIENNQKTIRIDIIDSNTASQKIFEKFGFIYIDTVEVYNKTVGLVKFNLYELILSE